MRTSGGLRSERCSARSWRLFSARSDSSCARRSRGVRTSSPLWGSVICQAGSVAARAAPPAPSATGSIAILRLVDLKSAAFEVLAVERLHCAGGIRIRHLHKAEPARPAGVAIDDQGDLLNGSMR